MDALRLLKRQGEWGAALALVERAGLTPHSEAIRGGTDGSRLTAITWPRSRTRSWSCSIVAASAVTIHGTSLVGE